MPEMKHNQVEVSQLLRAVDQGLSAGRDKGDPTERRLKLQLEDRDLWSKFKELTNEMIVTKSGRRMFPVMRLNVSGLDPNAMYSFLLDFVPVENHRWKYVNGDWVPGGKAEPNIPNTVYMHPDSPNFGAHWMKEPIMLNSLHKYQPRIHILRVGNGDKKTVGTFNFQETQFVAVTAYQNEEITALKIKYNPFAKAFQDAKERPDHRDFSSSFEDVHDEQKRLQHFATTWFLPPSGAALVPPPGHQFQGALPSLACDRFTLRDHRHTPYTHPFHRRSPTHASYASDPNLSMLNLTDNWANSMATVGSHGMSASHQGQYAMWNLSAANQSCAMSHHQYTPYIRTTAQYSLPPTPDTPGISVTAADSVLSPYDAVSQSVSLPVLGQNDVTSAAAVGFSTPSCRDLKSNWNHMTPP
ncbi:hypothetical protein LSH36_262g01008 [Paralvinella palmiformis]|uniref:T-box domain-containing protein n=1 Tax=Paralvinella palmiformis TaxID=53620 RepID=A0AAD9JKB6_9ANNE|nr:hypothetical protein LSH36_262g01008 [Paralvinella palmiformis]